MIYTLLITIVTEGVVVLAYCTWRRKPLLPILMTSITANIITQFGLRIVLSIFFRYYVAALLIAEVLILFFEGLLLSIPHRNQLMVRSAMLLSVSMNALSFGLGWFLPI